MTVRVTFEPPGAGSPERKLAQAELHFDDGPLAGLKLVGFAVWRTASEPGGLYVTFPARAVGFGPARRYYDFVRDEDGRFGGLATAALRDLLLNAYRDQNPN